MPQGKPAGVRCAQLDERNLCRLFGLPERPPVCGQFAADPQVCGGCREDAIRLLTEWEQLTA